MSTAPNSTWRQGGYDSSDKGSSTQRKTTTELPESSSDSEQLPPQQNSSSFDPPLPPESSDESSIDMPELKTVISPTRGPVELLASPEGTTIVYTDGSYRGGAGGIGIYYGDNHELNISRYVSDAKDNRDAEVKAAVVALETLKTWDKYENTPVIIRTDFYGIIDAMQKERFEYDEMKKLHDLAESFPKGVQFEHVYAHLGEHGNEMADELASQATAPWWQRSKSAAPRRVRSRSPSPYMQRRTRSCYVRSKEHKVQRGKRPNAQMPFSKHHPSGIPKATIPRNVIRRDNTFVKILNKYRSAANKHSGYQNPSFDAQPQEASMQAEAADDDEPPYQIVTSRHSKRAQKRELNQSWRQPQRPKSWTKQWRTPAMDRDRQQIKKCKSTTYMDFQQRPRSATRWRSVTNNAAANGYQSRHVRHIGAPVNYGQQRSPLVRSTNAEVGDNSTSTSVSERPEVVENASRSQQSSRQFNRNKSRHSRSRGSRGHSTEQSLRKQQATPVSNRQQKNCDYNRSYQSSRNRSTGVRKNSCRGQSRR